MIVKVLGAGLSGCEVALQLANRGIQVELYEMKPLKYTSAHSSDKFAELVCSNSFRNDNKTTANGVLINELRMLNSYLLKIADDCKISESDELIIDREEFSEKVTKMIKENKNIKVYKKIVNEIDDNNITIIATGPLTDESLSSYFQKKFGGNNLSFQDSTCPIIYFDSIDAKNSRIKILDDKICISLSKEQFVNLLNKLKSADIMTNNFDKIIELPQCCPIEYLAKKNSNQLLNIKLNQEAPRTNENYATVTLRKENIEGTAYSISGFMTQMSQKSQIEVIRTIPGLEQCKFARFGRSHKNTFFNAPKILDSFFRVSGNCYIIGQLSGIDGYVPAIATSLIASYCIYTKLNNKDLIEFPDTTMLGGFSKYITTENDSFSPMVASFHLLKQTDNYYNTSKQDLTKWIKKTKFI